MALIFIGMGLHDVHDVSLKGLKAARRCPRVYVEHYTSYMPKFSIEHLEKLLRKKVDLVSRKYLEGEGGRKIIKEAEEKDVAILTPGDPFIATTHIALRLEAAKANVETKIIHSSSVASAIPSLTGLSFYKFGRPVTMVYPETGYFPEVPYEVLEENMKRGLHTLVLLDVKVERGLHMSIPEALNLFLSLEKKMGRGVVSEEMLCIGIARAGSMKPLVKAGCLKKLMNLDFGPPPQSIVFPCKLHFIEEEVLMELHGVKKEILEKHKARVEGLYQTNFSSPY